MNSQTSTKQTEARPNKKEAKSAKKICAVKLVLQQLQH